MTPNMSAKISLDNGDGPSDVSLGIGFRCDGVHLRHVRLCDLPRTHDRTHGVRLYLHPQAEDEVVVAGAFLTYLLHRKV